MLRTASEIKSPAVGRVIIDRPIARNRPSGEGVLAQFAKSVDTAVMATRRPKKLTEKRLRNAAYAYLGRFASSEANLRQVLARKRLRLPADMRPDTAAFDAWVDAIVTDCKRLGYVNDEDYARMRVRADRRAGRSARDIRARLRHKGVADELITQALQADEDAGGDSDMNAAEWDAALRYARKRGLGPWRSRPWPEGWPDRQKAREKEMAALARRGFSYDLVRKIVDAASPQDLP